LTNSQRLALGHNPHGSVPDLLQDCLAAAVDSIVVEQPGGQVLGPAEFEETLRLVRSRVAARVMDVIDLVEPLMVRSRDVELALAAMTSPLMAEAKADMRAQQRSLLYAGFVAETGFARLRDLERYLRGILVRCDRAPSQVSRDASLMDTVARVKAEYDTLVAALPVARRTGVDVHACRSTPGGAANRC